VLPRSEIWKRVRHRVGPTARAVKYLACAKNVFNWESWQVLHYQLPSAPYSTPTTLSNWLARRNSDFLFIGITGGSSLRRRVNSGWEVSAKLLLLLGWPFAGFLLGRVMILVFSVWLEWLPTSGQGDGRNLIMPAWRFGWSFCRVRSGA